MGVAVRGFGFVLWVSFVLGKRQVKSVSNPDVSKSETTPSDIKSQLSDKLLKNNWCGL